MRQPMRGVQHEGPARLVKPKGSPKDARSRIFVTGGSYIARQMLVKNKIVSWGGQPVQCT